MIADAVIPGARCAVGGTGKTTARARVGVQVVAAVTRAADRPTTGCAVLPRTSHAASSTTVGLTPSRSARAHRIAQESIASVAVVIADGAVPAASCAGAGHGAQCAGSITRLGIVARVAGTTSTARTGGTGRTRASGTTATPANLTCSGQR